MKTLKERIINMFDQQPIIQQNFGKYLLLSLTDHIPATDPRDLKDATSCLLNLIGSETLFNCDKIIWEEDRGGFLSALVSYEANKPFSIAKWNPSGLEWDLKMDFRNAYTEGSLYLNGLTKGDRIVIVEDLIDTGGTIISLIKLLRAAEVEILDVVCLAAKDDHNGIKKIYQATGIQVKHAVKFSLEKGPKSVVTRSKPELF